jgi:hypothetical protein
MTVTAFWKCVPIPHKHFADSSNEKTEALGHLRKLGEHSGPVDSPPRTGGAIKADGSFGPPSAAP